MYYTIPNLLTIFRFILIPVFLNAFFSPRPLVQLLALPIFLLAAISDYLDGYLARRLKKTSQLGQFMDPLADKLLTISVLLAFLNRVEFVSHNGAVEFAFWLILLVEGVVTAFSVHAFYVNRALISTRTGKLKTVFQFLLLSVILLRFTSRVLHHEGYLSADLFLRHDVNSFVLVLLGVTVLFTLIAATVNLKVNLLNAGSEIKLNKGAGDDLAG